MPWIWRPLWGPVWINSFRRPKGQKNKEVCAKKDVGGRRGLCAGKFHIAKGETPRRLANNKKADKPNIPQDTVNDNEQKCRCRHEKPYKGLEAFLDHQFQQVSPGFFQFRSPGAASRGEQLPPTNRYLESTQTGENWAIPGGGHGSREKYQKIGITTDGIPIYTFT